MKAVALGKQDYVYKQRGDMCKTPPPPLIPLPGDQSQPMQIDALALMVTAACKNVCV